MLCPVLTVKSGATGALADVTGLDLIGAFELVASFPQAASKRVVMRRAATERSRHLG